MFGLERGIEAEFQLEDSELAAELLPDDDDRGRALFVESAEGGAGVLRRLVDEPGALSKAARRALEICHFDPESGADRGGVVDRTGERCARACYDCLLSYGNQGMHLLIDRHAARDVLLAVARTPGVTRSGDAGTDWDGVALATEADPPRAGFVMWLAAQGHRCPDRVGVDRPDLGARPDLVYDLADGPVAVFVDGPTDHETGGRDIDAEDALRDVGWGVVRVPHGVDFADVVSRYPSVFGNGRNGR